MDIKIWNDSREIIFIKITRWKKWTNWSFVEPNGYLHQSGRSKKWKYTSKEYWPVGPSSFRLFEPKKFMTSGPFTFADRPLEFFLIDQFDPWPSTIHRLIPQGPLAFTMYHPLRPWPIHLDLTWDFNKCDPEKYFHRIRPNNGLYTNRFRLCVRKLSEIFDITLKRISWWPEYY